MTDPSVAKMTPTQWVFELAGLSALDERKYEDIETLVKIGRTSFIDLMGLNIMPVEDNFIDEHGNEISKLRRPEDNEITPLALLCGNESMLSEVVKKNEEYLSQQAVEDKVESGELQERTPDELDEFFKEELEGDIEFLDDPFELKKKQYFDDNKEILGSMVRPLDEKDGNLKEAAEMQPPKRKSRVKVNT